MLRRSEKKKSKPKKGKKDDTDAIAQRWSGSLSDSGSDNFSLSMEGLKEHYSAMNSSKSSTVSSLARLKQVDPIEWSVEDVGVWLDWLQLSEYRPEFIRNSVSGSELFELDTDDFISLGVTKVGPRKRLEKRIRMLKHGLEGALEAPSVGDDDSECSSHSSVTSYSSGSSASLDSNASAVKDKLALEKVSLKLAFKDDISMLHVSPKIEFKELRRKITKEYGRTMTLKYKDEEGDLVRIRKTKHFRRAIQQWSGQGSLKLFLSEKKKKISNRQAAVLDTMVDAVVTINSKGHVLAFNKAAEEMFGYSKKSVLKKNIRMLMPSEVAMKHDEYMRTYLETGNRKIIGIGRAVQAKHSDGHIFPIHLSVSEAVQDGSTVFTGVMRKIENSGGRGGTTASKSSSSSSPSPSASTVDAMPSLFSLLDGLLDATVVINEKGIIQFWNKAATEKFGWTSTEVIGKNVKLMMPASIGEKHDGFIQKYLDTGKGTVIGIGRNVVAQKKNGEIFPIHLSLTEQQLGDGRRLFTGVIRDVVEEIERKKSLLQQEREVLDNIVVPAIIIDETGKIHAFNKAATELLGWQLIEIVGRNVSLLMTGVDKRDHDSYIERYVRTGEPRIIAKPREVIALHKDGSMIPVTLSVTVKRDGPKYIFTGVLQKIN